MVPRPRPLFGPPLPPVMFLSRIIKPDDSIPWDIVCRVNITETLGGVRAACCVCVCACRTSFRCELRTFGFPFGGASRLDESTLSEGHPLAPSASSSPCRPTLLTPSPDTSRTFARTYGHNSSVLFARGVASTIRAHSLARSPNVAVVNARVLIHAAIFLHASMFGSRVCRWPSLHLPSFLPSFPLIPIPLSQPSLFAGCPTSRPGRTGGGRALDLDSELRI